MSIRRDLVIKVSNGSATLDMPLQIYEKDHGIELRFKLMDYKYKYDKDPENILNSNKEDILEAYTTIVNPSGYELAQINGEVVEDTVKFMIEDSYTDELEELGTYQLQIHVKCKHSEFSIPPVRFEVLERLKGEKVVTDGDDEVDYSDILDGSTKFINDETGKLIIKWQKGDTISSVKLNAMVEVINNAVDEEVQRQLNEVKREQQELERQNKLDESMIEYETRFNALTASQQQDMEVIDARDGEVSLKARLDRDVKNPLQVYEDVEASYVSRDSTVGYARNVEIIGNTIQDVDNLADIRSVGDKVEGQELYKINVVSCGKNIYNISQNLELGALDSTKGTISLFDRSSNLNKNTNGFSVNVTSSYGGVVSDFIKINPNTAYTFSGTKNGDFAEQSNLCYFDKNKNFITGGWGDEEWRKNFTTPSNACYLKIGWWLYAPNTISYSDIQLEEGTVATEYEPYKEDKLTILSPVQLEKVGDVADRIICKDGVWGVEKNIGVYYTNGEEVIGMYNPNTTNTIGFRFDFKTTNTRDIIVEGFYYLHGDDDTKHCLKTAEQIILYIDRSELDTENGEGFKKWLKDNKLKIIYQTTQPQFIPLPHDQQVKLRTFAGKTNIHFETEIEGTIKASIPQSISSTISTHTEQIDNLNKELDRVKKLEESTVSTVTTESDFTTVTETSNGYFEDVKLEGKTLVNLCKIDDFSIINGEGDPQKTFNTVLSMRSGEYTLVFSCNAPDDASRVVGFLLDYNKWDVYPKEYYNGLNVIKLTITNEGCNLIRFRNDNVNTTVTISNILLLEGDHTQNPPEYFEGLKSVGDGVDEMTVESVDGDGNLFDGELFSGWVYNGVLEQDKLGSRDNMITNYIKVKPNQDYTNNFNFNYVWIFDRNRNFIKMINNNSLINVENGEYAIFGRSIARIDIPNTDTSKIQIVKGTKISKYEPHKSNKKQILYYNPTTATWEKPVLREWDSIEKHSDGKYYYHKRSGEVVLNGSYDWTEVGTIGDTILLYTIFDGKTCERGQVNICISDKFTSSYIDLAQTDTEGIYTGFDGYMCVRINTSKLSTIDPKGFKLWLQTNPTTVVYPLPEEKVYECTDLDLITYANETNLIVKSGALNPKTTLKVHSNTGNVVTLLQKKVLKLEESTITNDRKIAAIETKLEESTVSTVTTESDFTTVTETSNGYFEDVKLEGKTLVNLINYSKTLDANVWNHFVKTSDLNYMLTPNTEYTLIVYVQGLSKDKSFYIQSNDSNRIFDKASIYISSNGIWVLKATTKADFTNVTDVAFIAHNPDHKVGTYTISLCILEGDHTQNPPSYFEGLMSVGEDVEEMTVESVNDNLFNVDEVVSNYPEYFKCNDYIKYKNGADATYLKQDFEPNTQYSFTIKVSSNNPSNIDFYCAYTDGTYETPKIYNRTANQVHTLRFTSAINKSIEYFKSVYSDGSIITIYLDGTCINKGTTSKPYTPHQSNKKHLLYYNPTTQAWEKPILREWDSIEKHSDGKYYYHKRSGEHILNANSDEWLNGSNTSDTILEAWNYELPNAALPTSYTSPLICDKFKVEYSAFTENIAYSSTASKTIVIRIDKSKAQDINGFKAWLQANPVTVVYQLAQEEVYECINIDLITYENETNFIANTGAISPKSTLKVICNITNVVRELQQKVSNLENYIQHVMIDALNNALNE